MSNCLVVYDRVFTKKLLTLRSGEKGEQESKKNKTININLTEEEYENIEE